MSVFTLVFLVCNTMTGECASVVSSSVFSSLRECEAVGDISVQDGYTKLDDPSAMILVHCLNWGTSL